MDSFETFDSPPRDVITKVLFGNKTNLLAVSAWDQTVKFYDADQPNKNRLLYNLDWESTVLDFVFFENDKKMALADLNKNVSLLDVETKNFFTVGLHNGPVRCVRYHEPTNTLITGGWDKKVRVFDLRSSNLKPVVDVDIYGKTYCMDLARNFLVVGDSMKRIYVYDLSSGLTGFANPETKDGVLKFQYRFLKCFPDATGYVLSSIEGRVAWEYFPRFLESESQQYAFKCHRTKTPNDSDVAFPVNCVDFHPKFGTFVTGGADGLLCGWDGISRKRLWKSSKFNGTVASLSFNPAGDKLAIGVSDVFQLNPHQSHSPSLHLKHLKDEFRPRTRH
ncbi:mitotic checkpoint protein, BUB3 homologue, putative [Theileria annulata]|uniref:Mitotic checkpoint protein, BUB3 homologue, putative n=1 Tax=Theileria annulata TaxID=5874 RepID=Q4UF18_THEAN|nr:mitotic checkpoint protein, BUB3 homologue, putative [Theileria annulata]CAI74321.1 mitotic checkpoint protein, BUB3 homologue, putative [Theileria annulata]|eukprot:XP_952053.1 mitotic checkpoint protein, BUB3 homologue, putative [Theileria annulata]